MQIYVCVKHVPDTAAKITVVDGTGFGETCKFIVNPYDEYAVEEAVQLRDLPLRLQVTVSR
jgi:electron transfer flavoprotein beta subunit